MADRPGVARSIKAIQNELEYLREAGVLSPPQFQSILAQLPQEGTPSQYVDPRYGGGAQVPQQQMNYYGGGGQGYPGQGQQGYPGQGQQQYQQQQYQGPPPPQYYAQQTTAIAQAAQDPNHPANPSNPNHMEWAKKIGSKFGNAAIFGAGATAGGDLINSIF